MVSRKCHVQPSIYHRTYCVDKLALMVQRARAKILLRIHGASTVVIGGESMCLLCSRVRDVMHVRLCRVHESRQAQTGKGRIE